jgi:hypothetical protein
MIELGLSKVGTTAAPRTNPSKLGSTVAFGSLGGGAA